MKVNTFKQELKKKNISQLQEKLDVLRRDLFSLQLSAQTAHVKDHAKFKKLRKDIARVLTFIRQNDQSSIKTVKEGIHG